MSGLQTILFATTAVWGGIATLDNVRIRLVAESRKALDAITIDELRVALSEANLNEQNLAARCAHAELQLSAARKGEEIALHNEAQAKLDLQLVAEESDKLQEALAKAPKPAKAVKKKGKKS